MHDWGLSTRFVALVQIDSFEHVLRPITMRNVLKRMFIGSGILIIDLDLQWENIYFVCIGKTTHFFETVLL